MTVLSGARATEDALQGVVKESEIVHFATHGLNAARQVQPYEPNPVYFGDRLDDAVRRSALAGLALAGANRPIPANAADFDDGFLSAAEASALPLSRTRWAVLAGCGTARGLEHSWEGVLGIQRAFLVAGAQSVIATLWPVQDESAASFARELYRARARGVTDAAAAVREAERALIARLRADGRAPHPYYWGAFEAISRGRTAARPSAVPRATYSRPRQYIGRRRRFMTARIRISSVRTR